MAGQLAPASLGLAVGGEETMGWRYRRRVRLLPGVWMNVSKSGASFSVGRRGATMNVGKRGVRTTLGIP
ncbi:MAG: DUF4236 domain-containing protein, partial [Acetobacteraceae bacterium]|nr:DUF4236 domain-containing protein [Acetobacteraceae bacterium]